MRKSVVLSAVFLTALTTSQTAFAKGPPPPKPTNTIKFAFAGYTAVETSPYAVVRVTRSFTGAGTFVLTTSDGSAVAGEDYDPVAQTYAFGRKATFFDVFVPLRDDGVHDESPETVNLSLSLPPGTKGVTLAAPSSATLTITDDDTKLAAPSLTATRGASVGDISLSWSTPLAATTYTLWRSTTSGDAYTEVSTGSAHIYTDHDLDPITPYYYVVVAHAATYGDSDSSNEAVSTAKPHGGSLPDDLENATQAGYWLMNGLWHVSDDTQCAGGASGNHAFYYGQEPGCTYDTGEGNSGYLISPEYSIAGNENRLTFDYRLGTDGNCFVGPYRSDHDFRDVSKVSVSYDSGGSWVDVDACLPDASDWTSTSRRIAPNGATSMMVRFDVNTNDGTSNDHFGFAVDDIGVDTVDVDGEFLVPAGATLHVSDVDQGGGDPLGSFIAPNGADPVLIGYDNFSAGGPVDWVNTSDDAVRVRIALTDYYCSDATFYSDGTSSASAVPGVTHFDHALVTGSGPWTVYLRDTGGGCQFGPLEPTLEESNLKATVTVIPAP